MKKGYLALAEVSGAADLPKREAAVILMHDGVETGGNNPPPGSPGYRYLQSRKTDAEALPVIIEQLESQGYEFDKLYGFMEAE